MGSYDAFFERMDELEVEPDPEGGARRRKPRRRRDASLVSPAEEDHRDPDDKNSRTTDALSEVATQETDGGDH